MSEVSEPAAADGETSSPDPSATTPPASTAGPAPVGPSLAVDVDVDAAGRVCEVALEEFEGPLDLLLHLVRRHELDILDIPISFVCEKYLEYIEFMRALDLEVAGDYLVMAATLAYLKSRELVPQHDELVPDGESEEGPDPREQLIARLLEYQTFKEAALRLDARPMAGRDTFARGQEVELPPVDSGLAPITLFRLADAYQRVLERARIHKSHEVVMETISVAGRMEQLTSILIGRPRIEFEALFLERTWSSEGELRSMLVVTLMSVLELVRMGVISVHQPVGAETIVVERVASEEETREALRGYDETISFGDGKASEGPEDESGDVSEGERVVPDIEAPPVDAQTSELDAEEWAADDEESNIAWAEPASNDEGEARPVTEDAAPMTDSVESMADALESLIARQDAAESADASDAGDDEAGFDSETLQTEFAAGIEESADELTGDELAGEVPWATVGSEDDVSSESGASSTAVEELSAGLGEGTGEAEGSSAAPETPAGDRSDEPWAGTDEAEPRLAAPLEGTADSAGHGAQAQAPTTVESDEPSEAMAEPSGLSAEPAQAATVESDEPSEGTAEPPGRSGEPEQATTVESDEPSEATVEPSGLSAEPEQAATVEQVASVESDRPSEGTTEPSARSGDPEQAATVESDEPSEGTAEPSGLSAEPEQAAT
ncbi:MAG: segregation/condensation protein A, partial [Deltaproteobacteria bacterium]|nr:segregation/condensation protein A [Deltaproteobacteria bacterium]